MDVLAWMEGDEACVWTDRGELRFAPGHGRDAILRGDAWDVDGRLETLELEERDGLARRAAPTPTRCGAIWSALGCAGAGDVLVSAAA